MTTALDARPAARSFCAPVLAWVCWYEPGEGAPEIEGHEFVSHGAAVDFLAEVEAAGAYGLGLGAAPADLAEVDDLMRPVEVEASPLDDSAIPF